MLEKPSSTDSSEGKPEKKTLVHSSGRKSEAYIDKEKNIGRGGYGEVYRASVALVSDEEKIREIKDRYFVVKEFRDKKSDEAGRALEIHKSLVEAGVKTWPTYRRIGGEEAVLMTDGGKEDVGIVSTSDASRSKNSYMDKPIDIAEHVDEAVSSAIEDALRAGREGIILFGDAWFARLRDIGATGLKNRLFDRLYRRRRTKILDFFVGDYDNIGLAWKDSLGRKYEGEDALFKNLYELYTFSDAFADQFLARHAAEISKKISHQRISVKAEELDVRAGKQGRWDRYFQSYQHDRRGLARALYSPDITPKYFWNRES